MKHIVKILKGVLWVMVLPVAYLVVALICSLVPVHSVLDHEQQLDTIYLSSNGIHLDIVLPVRNANEELRSGLLLAIDDRYVSFGWGDKDFYLHTPTWKDLTIGTALKAMLIKSPALMHVTRYRKMRPDWIPVAVGKNELQKINDYISGHFQVGAGGKKILLPKKGYGYRDDFYAATGSFSCLHTCNSWVNEAFKDAGLKACLWTPFEFGLKCMYE